MNIEKWPQELLLARHGYSESNARKDAAKALKVSGEIPEASWAGQTLPRDMDVQLLPLGHRQSFALGYWLGRRYPASDPIDYIIMSPYKRTRQTTEGIKLGAIRSHSGSYIDHHTKIRVEERCREIEFGAFDRMTQEGIRQKYPEEAARRARDGKYYYRPPGGESRPDVRLRVDSFISAINRDYVGKRILVVCHSVVVLAFRSLIEHWEEKDYLQVDREDDVVNCGLTRYVRVDNKLKLAEYNTVIEEPVCDFLDNGVFCKDGNLYYSQDQKLVMVEGETVPCPSCKGEGIITQENTVSA